MTQPHISSRDATPPSESWCIGAKMRLLVATLVATCEAAYIGEFNVYSDGTPGGVGVYAKANVHADVNTETQVRVVMKIGTSMSNSATCAADTRGTIYFKNAAYTIDCNPNDETYTTLGGFAQDESGVYAGRGTIGTGRPPPSVAKQLLAIVACEDWLDRCPFVDSLGTAFFATFASHRSALLASDVSGNARLVFGRHVAELPVADYNAFVVGNERTLSMHAMSWTLWANETHAAVYSQPTASDSVGDVVGMFTMIVALVMFVGVSTHTTTRMQSGFDAPSSRDYSRLTKAIMADVGWSAALFVAWKVHRTHAYTEQPSLTNHTHRVFLNTTALAAVFASAVVVTCAAYPVKGGGRILRDAPSEWVWARASFENSLLVVATALIPLHVGRRFVLLLRYVTAFVICVVCGRDGCYIYRRSTTPERCAVAVHFGGFVVVATLELLLPVFWWSASFPNASYFVVSLSCAVAIASIVGGANIAGLPVAESAVIAAVPNDKKPHLAM